MYSNTMVPPSKNKNTVSTQKEYGILTVIVCTWKVISTLTQLVKIQKDVLCVGSIFNGLICTLASLKKLEGKNEAIIKT